MLNNVIECFAYFFFFSHVDIPERSGGYSWRLCKIGDPLGLTEACFQKGHLDFDPTKQVLKWNNGTLTYPMGDKAVFVAGVSW